MIAEIKAAIAVIPHPFEDKFLGVSRKDNTNDFGFPGGKREEIRPGFLESPLSAAIRETWEEAKINLSFWTNSYSGDLIYTGPDSTGIVVAAYYFELRLDFETLLEDVPESRSKIETMFFDSPPHETGLVKWATREELTSGSFSDYNKKILSLIP